MAENSAIGWTHHTFNPWRGCQKVAPGCTNCYAEALAKRNPSVLGTWGPQGTRVVAAAAYWREPLKWQRQAAAAGERHRVFCASLADVFEDWNGPITNARGENLLCNLADLRRRLFDLIDETPDLDWLLLTKRPENILRMTPAVRVNSQQQADDRNERGELYRRNVWLLTSVSEQATADANIPALLACRDLAPVLGVSAEPLLGPINLQAAGALAALDWLIVGGESGPRRRPCEVAWIVDVVDQCRAAALRCYVKQDAGPLPGQQGRIPDDVWTVKEFPS
ncbi:MAG TPA: DUF5131 family protein [Lacipirellulaceae bacterium]|nr:DUF5131 family protein [Lacipirellulaceae bacterium]